MKICSKCNVEKSLDEFSKKKTSKDGKRSQCKECDRQYNKKWQSNNPTYNTQYYKDNNYQCVKIRKQWRLDNPEYFKQWSIEHPESKHNTRVKNRAKRAGWGKPEPINNWFEGSHLHHLHVNDHTTCIYVPIELHESTKHAWNKPDTMKEINKLAMEWYLKC